MYFVKVLARFQNGLAFVVRGATGDVTGRGFYVFTIFFASAPNGEREPERGRGSLREEERV